MVVAKNGDFGVDVVEALTDLNSLVGFQSRDDAHTRISRLVAAGIIVNFVPSGSDDNDMLWIIRR